MIALGPGIFVDPAIQLAAAGWGAVVVFIILLMAFGVLLPAAVFTRAERAAAARVEDLKVQIDHWQDAHTRSEDARETHGVMLQRIVAAQDAAAAQMGYGYGSTQARSTYRFPPVGFGGEDGSAGAGAPGVPGVAG